MVVSASTYEICCMMKGVEIIPGCSMTHKQLLENASPERSVMLIGLFSGPGGDRESQTISSTGKSHSLPSIFSVPSLRL